MQAMGVYVLPLDRFKNPDIEFCRLLALQDFDAAYLPFYYSAQRFIHLIRDISPRTHIVMDSIDVHFLRNARQMLLEGTPNTWATFSSAKNREIAAYKLADAVLTVTEKDRDMLQKHLPFPPAISVSDPHNSRTQTPGFSERRHIVFLAGFKHTPNVDAAIFFHREIWPLVLEKLPDIRWYLLGDSPPPEIMTLGSSNVIVTGYVEHLEPYLQEARVAVAPLRFGAGMKGKIACSLAHGLPCVATSIGSEGMGLVHGENVMVAENPVEFCNAIIKLYTDESLWESISLAGKEVLDRKFGDSVIYPTLAGALKLENSRSLSHINGSDQVAVACRISHGYRLLGQGQADISEIVFMKCLEALPGSPEVMAGLALAQARQNKSKAALSTMAQALEAKQTHAIHLAYLAVIFKLSGNYDKALEAFFAAQGQDSANSWIAGEFASYLERLVQSDAGIQLISRYAEQGKLMINPLVQQATLSEIAQDFKGSSAALKVAMQIAKVIGDEISCRDIGLRISTLIGKLEGISNHQACTSTP